MSASSSLLIRIARGRATEFAAALGDPPAALRLVGIARPRDEAEAGGWLALLGKALNVADRREQDVGARVANALDAVDILPARQFGTLVAKQTFDLFDALVCMPDFSDKNVQLWPQI